MIEGCCQHCGEPRRREQGYCLECGARLPRLAGTLHAVRRAWIMRLGWYPGDWAPAAAATLVLAVVGAVAAVVVTHRGRSGAGTTLVASTVPGLAREAPATPAVAGTRKGGTQTGKASSNWPAARQGWTIILASYPAPGGAATARAAAAAALKRGLTGAGLLVSSSYPSLQPGYLIVFDGIYPGQPEATAALGSAKAAGFAGAYTRRIAR